MRYRSPNAWPRGCLGGMLEKARSGVIDGVTITWIPNFYRCNSTTIAHGVRWKLIIRISWVSWNVLGPVEPSGKWSFWDWTIGTATWNNDAELLVAAVLDRFVNTLDVDGKPVIYGAYSCWSPCDAKIARMIGDGQDTMGSRHSAIFIYVVACNSTTGGITGAKIFNVVCIGATYIQSIRARTDCVARLGRVRQRNRCRTACRASDRYSNIFWFDILIIIESTLQSVYLVVVWSYICPCVNDSGISPCIKYTRRCCAA